MIDDPWTGQYVLVIIYPPSMPCSGAPFALSSQYMQALPLPVVHPPLVTRIVEESDQKPLGTEVGVPPELQGSYREISSWSSLGSHGLPSTLYPTHSPVYGVALEDRRTSFMHDRTGTHMIRYDSVPTP